MERARWWFLFKDWCVETQDCYRIYTSLTTESFTVNRGSEVWKPSFESLSFKLDSKSELWE
jgi:hypothetical protein